jgi:hypothetical protein
MRRLEVFTGRPHPPYCSQSKKRTVRWPRSGAENWACVASLIETCTASPQTYFTDVLTKLVNLWPASRIDELMPWAWAAERSTNKLAA